jgi:hypothetical protein
LQRIRPLRFQAKATVGLEPRPQASNVLADLKVIRIELSQRLELAALGAFENVGGIEPHCSPRRTTENRRKPTESRG